MNFLKSPLGDDPLIVEGIFDASVEAVYQAWTEPTEFVTWFGLYEGRSGSAQLDVQIDGRWRYEFPGGMAWFEGRYTQVDDCRTLAFTWRHIEIEEDGTRKETSESNVVIKFEPRGDQTHIQLRHEGATSKGRIGIGRGWDRQFTNLEAKFAA